MANTFKSYGTQAVGTSNTTVYTAPAATTSTVIGMSVANVTAAIMTVDVTLVKSAVATHMIKGAPISPGGTLVIVGGDQKLVLQTTDTIKVVASVAASADVIVSVLEVA